MTPSLTSLEQQQLAKLLTLKLHPTQVNLEHWDSLIKFAADENVAMALYATLRREGFDLNYGRSWQWLIDYATLETIRYMRRKTAIKQLQHAADSAQVPMIFLKGVPLAHTVYPQPVQRPSIDVDVLVHEADIVNALKALQAKGFGPPQKPEDWVMNPVHPLAQRWSHHYVLTDGHVMVELHHRLLTDQDKFLPDPYIDWFWQRLQPFYVDEVMCYGFQPEAHLLYLCAHAMLQHQAVRLVSLYDLHLLITQSAALDWGLVEAYALRFHWGWMVDEMLRMTQSRFDTPLPTAFLTNLQASHGSEEDRLIKVSREILNRQSPTLFQETLHNWGTMTPRERAMMLVETLFPHGDELVLRNPNKLPRWRFYLRYWRRLINRFGSMVQSHLSSRGDSDRS